MSSALNATIKVSAQFAVVDSLDLSSVTDQATIEFLKTIANGTSVDQADILWHDSRSVASGGNDDLDLTALTRSIFSNTVTTNFVKVKAILIIHTSTTTGEKLNLDSSVTNGFTGPFESSITSKASVGADSPLLLASLKDGWATGGSNKVLRVHNGGAASATYKIFILGTSA